MSEPHQEVAEVLNEADVEEQQEEEMTKSDIQNEINEDVTSGGDEDSKSQQHTEDTNKSPTLRADGADGTEDTPKLFDLQSAEEQDSQQTQDSIPDLGVVHAPIQEIHDIDLRVDIPATRFLIDDLNKDAAKLADSINHLSGGLAVNLHALSHICTQYISVHEMAVTEVGVAVDRSLAAMSSLMIGCEQISENMPPVEQLMEQLTKVKETLDILEATVGPEFQ
eukprot:m.20651 g.20651  ORF g.20651 m.20651 type:complete len:223 (-) comp13035_c1_seq1:77-745(-)